jgi:DNA-3-methyladenine glycosylase
MQNAITRSDFLPADFYLRPTLTVARELLGKILVRRLGDRVLSGRIVEVEAYHQDGDASAHSFGGKSGRNEVMFRRGGYLYVYFTYGMHFCMNVVTEADGIGAAVLLRAVEPLEGLDVMHRHRGAGKQDRDLASGPAKICQAFGISGAENGLLLDGSVVGIRDAAAVAAARVEQSSRVGISKSKELPWRFFLRDNRWISRGKPSLSVP